MRTLARVLTALGTGVVLGGCGQPQAAEDPMATMKSELTQLRTRVDTLEQEQVVLKKESQECRADLDEVKGGGEEPSIADEFGSEKKSSSSRKSSRSGGGGGGSGSGSAKDVRMPGDG